MADDTHIDLRQTVAALRQQLEARTAERDEALAREAAFRGASDHEFVPQRSHLGVDAILAKARALCGVEHGALITYDGGYFRLAADHGMPQIWIKQFRQPYRGSSLHPGRMSAFVGLTLRHGFG